MKKIALIAGWIFVGATAGLGQDTGRKWTLKQCVDTALANNLPVKQYGLLTEEAKVNVSQARSNLLPNLNGSFGYGFSQGRSVDPITNNYINQHLGSSSVGLNSNLILFNGFRLQNLVRQNEDNYQAAKMEEQQIKDNLTLNVILTYLQVLSAEDAMAIQEENLAVLKKQVERMEILVKEGAVGTYQLTDLQGQQADEELSLLNRRNDWQQNKLSLSQLMNIAFDPAMQLDRGEEGAEIMARYAASASDVYQQALSNLSVVKANEWKEKGAQRGITIARAGFFPTLSFNANMGSSYSSLATRLNPSTVTVVPTGDYVVSGATENPVLRRQQNYDAQKIGYARQLDNNLGTFAGINLSIPLFNNFLNRNRVKTAKLNRTYVSLEAENVRLQLRKDIDAAWLNMASSFEKYKVLMAQEKSYAESFRAAEVRFNTGVINAFEYLQAKRNLDQARVNRSLMKYDYLFRTRLLDFYTGKTL